jgi:hypothetical protein
VLLHTKAIKGSKLVQLVKSYRNQEVQPRPRFIVSQSDTQSPNPEQALIYQRLSIRWKDAFAPTKSCVN